MIFRVAVLLLVTANFYYVFQGIAGNLNPWVAALNFVGGLGVLYTLIRSDA